MPHRQSHLGGDDISSPKTKREEAHKSGERSDNVQVIFEEVLISGCRFMTRQGIMRPQMGVAGRGRNSDSYKVSSGALAAIT